MPGFIASQIGRINRNFVLVALALAVSAMVVGWLGANQISAVVLGPKPVTAEELASAQFQSEAESFKKVVQLNGSEVRPVFYSARVRRGKGYGTLYCWLLKARDRQIIVEDWSPSRGLAATGQPRIAPPGIYHYANAYRGAGEILPILIDQREWKESGWMLAILVSALGAAALVITGVLFWWSQNPERHPVRRAVARLGDFESTAMQIDGEMQSELGRFGTVHLGQTTLIYTPAFSFDVVRLESITGARTEWLRKGKSSALYLLLDTREQRKVKWQISRTHADDLLKSVCSAAHVEASEQAQPRRIELKI